MPERERERERAAPVKPIMKVTAPAQMKMNAGSRAMLVNLNNSKGTDVNYSVSNFHAAFRILEYEHWTQ